MPEFGPKGNFEGFRKAKQDVEYRTENKLAEAELTNEGFEILGHGGEHVVVAHGKDKVAAIEHSHTSETAEHGGKAIFYCSKILHMLMPSHFPDVHAVFGFPLGNKHMGQGTVRERIEPGIETSIVLEEEGFLREAEMELHEKLKAFEAYGLDIYNCLDHWGYNFQRVKGAVVYMDKLEKAFINTPDDVQNLERYMTDHQYSSADMKRVLSFAKRVVALQQ